MPFFAPWHMSVYACETKREQWNRPGMYIALSLDTGVFRPSGDAPPFMDALQGLPGDPEAAQRWKSTAATPKEGWFPFLIFVAGFYDIYTKTRRPLGKRHDMPRIRLRQKDTQKSTSLRPPKSSSS